MGAGQSGSGALPSGETDDPGTQEDTAHRGQDAGFRLLVSSVLSGGQKACAGQEEGTHGRNLPGPTVPQAALLLVPCSLNGRCRRKAMQPHHLQACGQCGLPPPLPSAGTWK